MSGSTTRRTAAIPRTGANRSRSVIRCRCGNRARTASGHVTTDRSASRSSVNQHGGATGRMRVKASGNASSTRAARPSSGGRKTSGASGHQVARNGHRAIRFRPWRRTSAASRGRRVTSSSSATRIRMERSQRAAKSIAIHARTLTFASGAIAGRAVKSGPAKLAIVASRSSAVTQRPVATTMCRQPPVKTARSRAAAFRPRRT